MCNARVRASYVIYCNITLQNGKLFRDVYMCILCLVAQNRCVKTVLESDGCENLYIWKWFKDGRELDERRGQNKRSQKGNSKNVCAGFWSLFFNALFQSRPGVSASFMLRRIITLYMWLLFKKNWILYFQKKIIIIGTIEIFVILVFVLLKQQRLS